MAITRGHNMTKSHAKNWIDRKIPILIADILTAYNHYWSGDVLKFSGKKNEMYVTGSLAVTDSGFVIDLSFPGLEAPSRSPITVSTRSSTALLHGANLRADVRRWLDANLPDSDTLSHFTRRAFLASHGFDSTDLDRPSVGIADTSIDSKPATNGRGAMGRGARNHDANYDALARAATDAVEGSLDEMQKITARVGRLTHSLENTADALRARNGNGNGNETDPYSQFTSEIDGFVKNIDSIFRRQLKAFRTFNVVMFGRTGVGKSTLISAMTRSDGASVSQGESDWTTAVEPLEWHSCRLYDTPGINGWGRTDSREDLETRAREAVEVADLVLVCFDSQSQQAGEFEKVAAWVQSYRKPVIAVLNARNPRWRLPPRVPVGSARAELSRAVREHAGNIRDELAKIGLTAVPVIALSLKRALFARAALPFRGPDGQSLESQQEKFGVDMLERWSRYSALEDLLVKAVCENAVPLRIGALNDQLRGVLRELHMSVDDLQRQVGQAAETIESDLIAPLLRILGYPRRDRSDLRQPFLDDQNRDILGELERYRGGAFQASVEGEFHQFVAQRLDAELGALRARSLQSAEECVIAAFERRRNISADEVQRTSFDESEMREKAEAVLRESGELLERRAKLARRDAQLDLRVLSSRTAPAVEGEAGRSRRLTAWGFRGAGILSSAAATLGTFALFTSWNPLGLATAAVAGGFMLAATAGSMIFGWLGGKTRKESERRRLSARRQDLAKVRRNVHEVYDRFKEKVIEHAHSYVLKASAEVLRGPVEQALVHRTLQARCSSLLADFADLSKGLPRAAEPQALLWEVAATIEREAFPEDPNAADMHWLGEDWIKDPLGLDSAQGSTEAGRTKAYDPSIIDRLFSGINDIFDRIADDVTPGSGTRWLTTAFERCAGDADAVSALSDLRGIADRGRPRIHVVGDYSTGKTSLIKRLLIDAGALAPETLEVRGNPTTATPREYDWDGITLIDNPGFQSGEAAHAEKALRALSDASALLYLFQPNLILGDDSYMTTVLLGSKDRGVVPRQDHTFFVVNRSDELGVDPVDDPDAYRQLVQRKKTELSLALRSRNIAVSPESVFCMASDPYGLVGSRTDVDASAFDPCRDWDGLRQFTHAVRRIKTRLRRSGCDRSILGGGLARLAELQARERLAVETLKAKDGALARLQTQIDESIAEGTRLGAKHRADLERLVAEHAAGFRDEVLSEQDQDRLQDAANRLKEWWTDEALHAEVEQWASATASTLNSWQERSFEAIERRLRSPEFRAMFADHREDAPELSGANRTNSLFAKAVGKSGNILGSATRNTVYQIGKALGVKFRPWGAVKLAAKLGKVGVALAAVGVVLDFVDSVLDERRYKKRERERAQVARFLEESVPRVVKKLAFGDEDEDGILKVLEGVIGTLEGVAADHSRKRGNLAAVLADANRKLATYADLIADGARGLGDPWEGE